MSAPVDVLAVLDFCLHQAGVISKQFFSSQRLLDHAKEVAEARAAVAAIIEERDALRWALEEYPKRNTQQLQARKVCDGVAALARCKGGA